MEHMESYVQHYLAAERILKDVQERFAELTEEWRSGHLQRAQVHATLANASALAHIAEEGAGGEVPVVRCRW